MNAKSQMPCDKIDKIDFAQYVLDQEPLCYKEIPSQRDGRTNILVSRFSLDFDLYA